MAHHFHKHSHPHSDPHSRPNTEGITISWAYFYDLLVKALFLGGEGRMRSSIVKLAQIKSGDKVLDVGCGTGTLAITAKRKSDPSVQVMGIDPSPEMIERARLKANRKGVDVHFKVGVVEAIDAPDNTFDLVMNSFMVHHLPGDLKSQAFAEMYRVLKPGGRVMVVDFEPPKPGVRRTILTAVLGHGMLGIDNTTVPPLLQEAGFTSVVSGGAGHPLATYISGCKPSQIILL